jgi:hypothetical protein
MHTGTSQTFILEFRIDVVNNEGEVSKYLANFNHILYFISMVVCVVPFPPSSGGISWKGTTLPHLSCHG